MGSLFSNMTTNGLEEQKDVLGGFTLFDSGVYQAKIKVAYAGSSQSGARNITLHADINGKEYRETIYITNKNGDNFYLNKNDASKKIPLAGFSIINDLCLIATGKPLCEMDTKNKTLNVYNAELQKEIPTQVPVIMELCDKVVEFGILKEKKYKVQNTDKGFVETDEIRESNVINKVFDAKTHQTVYEIAHGLTEAPLFCDKWQDKNNGVTVDRTKKGKAEKPAPQKVEYKSLFA